MVGLDAQLSTRFGTLHIEGGGWQLSCQPKNAALNLPRLPAGSPVWSVINQGLLKVHGWNPGCDSAWQGVFVPGAAPCSPQRHGVIKGVGDCKMVTVDGCIVGCPDQNLPARLEFAMAQDRSMMLWRAELRNRGPRDVELETMTLLNGHAGVGGTISRSTAKGLASSDLDKAMEVGLWAWAALVLMLPFTLRLASTLLRFIALSSAFASASFACKALQSSLSLSRDPVWRSALVNGWQSFSYAGYLALDACYGVAGAARRFLCFTGLYAMQPAPQTGAAFSGAFHDGARMPPRAWLGRQGSVPSWLSPFSWRQTAPVQSDMFTSLVAGFGSSIPAADSEQLVLGFLGQREQFGLVALDPWTQAVALHASCDGALLKAPAAAAVPRPGEQGGGRLTTKLVQPVNANEGRGEADGRGGAMFSDWAAGVWSPSGADVDESLRLYMDTVGEHLDARVPLPTQPLTLTPTPPPGGGGVGGGGGTPTRSPARTPPPERAARVRGGDEDAGPTEAGKGRGRETNKDDMLTGWCSWYELMERVREKDLAANADSLKRLHDEEGMHLSVLQLDDGYTSHWGDWHDSETCPTKFPSGLRGAAEAARSHSLVPGLWLAPWAADKGSKIALAHPEWMMRKRRIRAGAAGWWCRWRALLAAPWKLGLRLAGYPLSMEAVNSGLTHPGKWFYGLDATNPQCRTHVADILRHLAREIGFKFLKLDFLHVAAAAAERHDPTRTRAQALQLALRTLREGAGEDCFILGCSCPLGAAVGWVDAMRVSADTSHEWFGYPIPWDKTNLPGGGNMFRNVLVRQVMHGRWWINNPDCLLLAPPHSHGGERRPVPVERRHSSERLVAPGVFLEPGGLDLAGQTGGKGISRRVGGGVGQRGVDEAVGRATLAALCGGLLFLSDQPAMLPSSSLAVVESILPPLTFSLDWRRFSRGATTVPFTLPVAQGEESPHALAVELSGPEGPWVLVGLFNLTNREDARAVALSHLPMGRMEERRAAGGVGGGVTGERSLSPSYDVSDMAMTRSPSETPKEVFAFEFWRSQCSRGWASSVCVHPVPPRSASLVAVRWREPSKASYLGSDVHYSCGLELVSWTAAADGMSVHLTLELPRLAVGHIWVRFPAPLGVEGDGGQLCARPRATGAAFRGGAVEPAVLTSGKRMEDVWKVPVRLEGGVSHSLVLSWAD